MPREGERGHSISVPEIDLLQSAPREARSGSDHHFGQLDALRFKAAVSQIHVALDLHTGRLAESVNSFYRAFEEKRIILLQDFVPLEGEQGNLVAHDPEHGDIRQSLHTCFVKP